MKLIHYLAITLITAFFMSFMSCKSNKGNRSAVVEAYSPSTQQMDFANKRWLGTTEDELKQGQTIYTSKCTDCHKNFPVEKFSEKKWLHEIDDMSPKAKLTADEKTKLTKYLLSMRDTKVGPVTN